MQNFRPENTKIAIKIEITDATDIKDGADVLFKQNDPRHLLRSTASVIIISSR